MDWLSPISLSIIVSVLFLAPLFLFVGIVTYTKRILSKDRVSPLGADLVDELSTTEDFSVVRQEGNRKVKRQIKHYNLDAIVSMGYRVCSMCATQLHLWATHILKAHLVEKGISLQVYGSRNETRCKHSKTGKRC